MLPPILNFPEYASGSFPPTVIKNGARGSSPLRMLMHGSRRGIHLSFWYRSAARRDANGGLKNR